MRRAFAKAADRVQRRAARSLPIPPAVAPFLATACRRTPGTVLLNVGHHTLTEAGVQPVGGSPAALAGTYERSC